MRLISSCMSALLLLLSAAFVETCNGLDQSSSDSSGTVYRAEVLANDKGSLGFDALLVARWKSEAEKYPGPYQSLLKLSALVAGASRENCWRHFHEKKGREILSSIEPREAAHIAAYVSTVEGDSSLITTYVQYGDAPVAEELILCMLASPILRTNAVSLLTFYPKLHSKGLLQEALRSCPATEKDTCIEVLLSVWRDALTVPSAQKEIERWEATKRFTDSTPLIESANRARCDTMLNALEGVVAKKLSSVLGGGDARKGEDEQVADAQTIDQHVSEIVALFASGRKSVLGDLLIQKRQILSWQAKIVILQVLTSSVLTSSVKTSSLDLVNLKFAKPTEDDSSKVDALLDDYSQLSFADLKWESTIGYWRQ